MFKKTLVLVTSMMVIVLGQTELGGVSLLEAEQTKTVLNYSREPVLAIACVYNIVMPHETEVRKVEYVMSFVGPLLQDEALLPGEHYELFDGPLKVEPGVWVDRIDMKITGLVFRSGRVAGPDGPRLRSYLKDTARESGHQVRDIQRRLEGLPPAEAERLIADSLRLVKGRNAAMVHHNVKKRLLDENGNLRPDYLEILQGLTLHLARF